MFDSGINLLSLFGCTDTGIDRYLAPHTHGPWLPVVSGAAYGYTYASAKGEIDTTLKRECRYFDETFVRGCTEVVILTTFVAANDKNFIKMTTFTFQCILGKHQRALSDCLLRCHILPQCHDELRELDRHRRALTPCSILFLME